MALTFWDEGAGVQPPCKIPGELLTDGIRSVDLEELYRQADVISCTVRCLRKIPE